MRDSVFSADVITEGFILKEKAITIQEPKMRLSRQVDLEHVVY